MTTKTIASPLVAAPVFAGIDVGAAELVLLMRNNDVSMKAQVFSNTR